MSIMYCTLNDGQWSRVTLAMSTATPTSIPRDFIFPLLLPNPPEPYPTPLPRCLRTYSRLSARRDLVVEMEDLSDEEVELEEQV
jgi:hypothetical protein